MPKKLTSKDLEILSEMMLLEELAYKKSSLYEKQFKEQELKDQCKVLAENHKSRYTALNDYLASHN
ncbi:MAG TPA: hypothetical protein VIL26_02680 [Clostridia bacterium]